LDLKRKTLPEEYKDTYYLGRIVKLKKNSTTWILPFNLVQQFLPLRARTLSVFWKKKGNFVILI